MHEVYNSFRYKYYKCSASEVLCIKVKFGSRRVGNGSQYFCWLKRGEKKSFFIVKCLRKEKHRRFFESKFLFREKKGVDFLFRRANFYRHYILRCISRVLGMCCTTEMYRNPNSCVKHMVFYQDSFETLKTGRKVFFVSKFEETKHNDVSAL